MINVKILEEKENPILKRKDLLLMLDHKGEPTPKT
ncbi:MAG: 30S ribosomal protein S24e, partial [Candidatus Aenigmarchaeota archaeon CG_4_10_14_0_8_um_filter_37_24]